MSIADFPKKLSHNIAISLLNTLQAIQDRDGSKMPSHDVQVRAMNKLGAAPQDRGVSEVVTPARIFHIRSSDKERTYLVSLYIHERTKTVADAECSCPSTGVCWHILVALTYANNDGYRLEV